MSVVFGMPWPESKRVSTLSIFFGRNERSKTPFSKEEQKQQNMLGIETPHVHLEPDVVLCYILRSMRKYYHTPCACACQLPCPFLALILVHTYALAVSALKNLHRNWMLLEEEKGTRACSGLSKVTLWNRIRER